MTKEESKKVIEALLFASEKPIPPERMKDVIGDVAGGSVRALVDELNAEYKSSGRSFNIIEIAGGYQIATDPAYAPYIRKLYKTRREDRLSQPALETLAVIAYKQPATRADIEFVRGVNVDGVMKTLTERGLVKIVGRKDALGRPILYGTTREFLQYFGINSLTDLPSLREISEEEVKLEADKIIEENKDEVGEITKQN